jgi:hypothetical protein
MFCGCIFNLLTTPELSEYKEFFDLNLLKIDPDLAKEYDMTRKFWLPISHGVLMIINYVTNNPRLNLDAVKAFASFIGMII